MNEAMNAITPTITYPVTIRAAPIIANTIGKLFIQSHPPRCPIFIRIVQIAEQISRSTDRQLCPVVLSIMICFNKVRLLSFFKSLYDLL